MNRLRIPRQRAMRLPRWVEALARSLRRAMLRCRIHQMRQMLADTRGHGSVRAEDVALWEARLAELRCELHALELQR